MDVCSESMMKQLWTRVLFEGTTG